MCFDAQKENYRKRIRKRCKPYCILGKKIYLPSNCLFCPFVSFALQCCNHNKRFQVLSIKLNFQMLAFFKFSTPLHLGSTFTYWLAVKCIFILGFFFMTKILTVRKDFFFGFLKIKIFVATLGWFQSFNLFVKWFFKCIVALRRCLYNCYFIVCGNCCKMLMFGIQ